MASGLRILYVVDDRARLERVGSILATANGSPHLEIVENREDFLAATTMSRWDILLCDYPHQAFDGFTVLLEASGIQEFVPLIFLGHQSSLRDAVGSIKAGAADFVPFTELQRLPSAIERALREAADQRERAQERRRLQEQAALIDLTQDGIIVIDLEGHVLHWNRGAEHLFGWTAEEALKCKLHELLKFCAPDGFPEYVHLLLSAGEWSGELTKHTRQGHQRIVQSRWSLMREPTAENQAILVVDSDITEQKKMEIQLLRAQRLESIGTLAGGIAHDLNNVLAPILLSVQMLREEFGTETAKDVLDTVEISARRGSNIIKQVLTFARGVTDQFAAVSPDGLISDIQKIAQETFPKAIHLQTLLPEGAWMIHGDATQLQQVLMNLAVNARDAMPNGGLLRLSAENVWVDENLVRLLPAARTGPFVLLQVSDTGQGIAPENLERIFDPFFSTKDPDKGTGLGLSTAMGIIKSHKGFIQVESQLNAGSKFKVFLPAVAAVESCLETGSAPELLRGQGQTILVVDDEESVRTVTQRTLERYGYQVMTASDGAEAVALFAQDPTRIDLVLTDLMMPFMDGTATIRALRRMKPNVRLVVASGLASQARVGEVQHLDVQAVLRKPFNAETLLTTVHKILHHASLGQS